MYNTGEKQYILIIKNIETVPWDDQYTLSHIIR